MDLVDYVGRAWNLIYGVMLELPHVFITVLSFSIGGYALKAVLDFFRDL